jgi:ribosomal protein L28
LNQILYADDTALVADKEIKLQSLATEFGKICERRTFSVNVAKSKLMTVTISENVDNLNITANGVRMEEVQCFQYRSSFYL